MGALVLNDSLRLSKTQSLLRIERRNFEYSLVGQMGALVVEPPPPLQ